MEESASNREATDMSERKPARKSVVVIVVLSLACVVQAAVIWMYAAKSDQGDGPFDDIDKFSTFLDRKLKNDQNESRDLFDRFFDDRFFSGKKDPFQDLEQFRQRLQNRMDENIRDRFDDSWNEWIGDRFSDDGDGVKVHMDESKDAYVYTVDIPNLKDNELNINIDPDGIHIEGDFSQRVEKKDPQGHVIAKQEMHRTLSKNLALPKDADQTQAKIENKKDKIVIKIPRAPS